MASFSNTGQTDVNGRPIFQSSEGGWYTQQNGQMKPITSADSSGFSTFLSGIGLTDPQNISITKTGNAISGFTLPASYYNPIDPSNFADQAGNEVSPYYDKNLELMNKTIDTLISQHQDVKTQEEEYQGQQQQSYYKTENQDFAKALDSAQNNFAGMGTWDSGGRLKVADQNQTNREDALTAQNNAFQNSTDTRNTEFSQYLTNEGLSRDQQTLDITRNKNDDILSREQQLASAAQDKRNSALDLANSKFSQYLGVKDNLTA